MEIGNTKSFEGGVLWKEKTRALPCSGGKLSEEGSRERPLLFNRFVLELDIHQVSV
jgi:hypothetical protein